MVNSTIQNNPLYGGRDYSYCPGPGLNDSYVQAETMPTRGQFEGSGTIMKKVAIVTVAVLALGLAACNKSTAENNAANETAVENNASYDVNAATNESVNAADNALNVAGNDLNAAGNEVSNASNAVSNASTNK